MPTRKGIVGKQKEIINGIEVEYLGGGHQYEFINNWNTDNFSDFLIRLDNYITLE